MTQKMAELHFSEKENVMKQILALSLLTISSASFAVSTPVDLSTWSADTYDLTGGQSAGNWVLSNSNQTVTQTVNADPSVYLNNLNQTSYSMDGSWQSAGGDDDFIGFVFGYQNDHQYYVMDWKASGQNAGTEYGTALEGFRILKVDASSRASLVLKDFWESGTSNSTVLASNLSTSNGWVANKSYDFHLDFLTTPGDISILVKDGSTTLWDVTINDLTYSSGQFGFYNFSQANVQYSGFEQTGGVIVPPNAVPIPAAAFMFAPALLGFMGLRRKAKKLAA
tara:strand:- start:5628 stop:6470 length:843 start_codon:yes stop_codon:yes gene_type:complete